MAAVETNNACPNKQLADENSKYVEMVWNVHDGSKEADVKMRERIKARRDELRQRV